MILKNVKAYGVDDVTVVKLGEGNIKVGSFKSSNKDNQFSSISFANSETHEIGFDFQIRINLMKRLV